MNLMAEGSDGQAKKAPRSVTLDVPSRRSSNKAWAKSNVASHRIAATSRIGDAPPGEFSEGSRSSRFRSTIGSVLADGSVIFESGKASNRYTGGALLSSRRPLSGRLHVVSEKEDADVPAPGRNTVAAVMAAFIGCAAISALFGGFMYDFSPTDTSTGVVAVLHDAWLTYILVISIFAFEGACSAASRENRRALWERANTHFVLLLVPSAMDVLVTGMAILALAFVPPALVH